MVINKRKLNCLARVQIAMTLSAVVFYSTYKENFNEQENVIYIHKIYTFIAI
jgi:hypothetical protein